MQKTSLVMAHVVGLTLVAAGARAQQPDPGEPAAAADPTTAPAVGQPTPGDGAAPSAAEPPPPAATPVAAGGAEVTGTLGDSTTGAAVAGEAETGDETPWIQRFVPGSGMAGEVGLFLGLLIPSSDHNFHDEEKQHQGLGSAAFDFGIRAAFLPIPFLGAELEGALMPTATDDGQGATIWAVRAHGLLQAPVSRISPFVLLGGGRMGALSDPLGNDADPLLHFGVGAKLSINDRVLARLDIRDNLTQKNGAALGSLTHHPEFLIGLSYRLPPIGSAQPAPMSTDADGDGIPDPSDECPQVAGPGPSGCPVADGDQDGIPDEVDQCPDKQGVQPHGCPPVDTDGDGFFDESDQCPEQPGIAPTGCPAPDTDGDGINDTDDRCPDQPETGNGYEDDDGCPDELPQAVQEFTGAIQGIQFDTGQATITPDSRATLDRAVAVLNEYPKLRIEIAGHTDNVGDRASNLDLSNRRAAAVKDYLVAHGIDGGRVETIGYGPDRPVVSNDSREGRRQNRRIEFRLLP